MDFTITDAFFEDLKYRRKKVELKLEVKLGGKAAKSRKRQRPAARKPRQKTA
jgi:hypothetical protein